jgi:hypothetical protein
MLTEVTGTVKIDGPVKVVGISDLEQLLDNANILFEQAERHRLSLKEQEWSMDARMLYKNASKAFIDIQKKYPRDYRVEIGCMKAHAWESISNLRYNAYFNRGIVKEHIIPFFQGWQISRLMAIKDDALIAVTDAHGRKEIEKVYGECEREMRAALEQVKAELPSSSCAIWLLVAGVIIFILFIIFSRS